MENDTKQALHEAIDECGGVQSFANMLTKAGIKTSRFQVYRWSEGLGPPAEHCKTIERLTGVPKSRLRPDLWDAAE